MKNGTPSTLSNGQLATIAARIISALPNGIAHSGLDVPAIIRATDRGGARLSVALAKMLCTFCKDYATARLPKYVESPDIGTLEQSIVECMRTWGGPLAVQDLVKKINEKREIEGLELLGSDDINIAAFGLESRGHLSTNVRWELELPNAPSEPG